MGTTIGIGNRVGSQSSSSYWTQQKIVATFLFDAFTKDIVGGKLYNRVAGRTSEYLTITGSAGSYHYECPNTPDYINADLDFAWFKTDGSVSDMTDSRLNSYDLQRTPVQFDNASPNTNRRIAILLPSIVLTAGRLLDEIFQRYDLPIEWHNDTNAYGHIKDNRAGQNLWIPEEVTPAVLSDTSKTAAWYIADDLTTITKDGSDNVSQWRDKNATGNDLNTLSGTPNWSANGIRLTSSDEFMRGIFTLNKPVFLFIVFKQVTWGSPRRIWDGKNLYTMASSQYDSTPKINMYGGGTPIQGGTGLGLDTWGIVRALYNGASSKLIINEVAAVTGDTGTLAAGGFVLNNNADLAGGTCADIEVKEIVIGKVAYSTVEEASIFNYLKNKYSL